MPRLNDRAATNARPSDADLILWDDQLAGFGLRVKPSGVRSWIADYRDDTGRKVRATLGRFPAMGAATARREALKTLGERPPSKRRDGATMTLAQFWVLFDRHKLARLKPRTRKDRACMWTLHLRPALGSRPLASITTADVNELLTKVWSREGLRFNLRRLLVSIYRQAALMGFVPPGFSPASSIKVPPIRSRLRFLAVDEWMRFGQALEEVQRTARGVEASCNAIRFICLSGFRKVEALTLSAGMVDTAANRVTLPDSKTGPQERNIPPEASAFLAGIWPADGGYFFPGRRIGHPLVDVDKTLAMVLGRAGIAGRFTLHTIRHSWAETALANDVNPRVLQSLLGHKSLRSTLVYSHVRDRVVRQGAATVGGAVARALGMADPAAAQEEGSATLDDSG